MNYDSVGQLNFFSEMAEQQISAREFLAVFYWIQLNAILVSKKY